MSSKGIGTCGFGVYTALLDEITGELTPFIKPLTLKMTNTESIIALKGHKLCHFFDNEKDMLIWKLNSKFKIHRRDTLDYALRHHGMGIK